MTLAAGTGDLEAIQYLLSVGVSPGDRTGAALSAAITARCEACARLLVERGAPANALRPNGTLNTNVGASSGGVLNDTAKRADARSSLSFCSSTALLSSRRTGSDLLC